MYMGATWIGNSHLCLAKVQSLERLWPCLGEKIDWIEAVDPSLTGAVELWMGEVEGVIRRTLHKLAGQALAAYATTQRSKWILEWPGQLVLNCSQVSLTASPAASPDGLWPVAKATGRSGNVSHLQSGHCCKRQQFFCLQTTKWSCQAM